MNGSSIGMALSIVYGVTIAVLGTLSVNSTVLSVVAIMGAGILAIFWTVGRKMIDKSGSGPA